MGYAEHRGIIIQIGGGLDILKGEQEMIKLEHVVLASPEQMEFIIEGMRNPMNSWNKTDSFNGCETYKGISKCLDCDGIRECGAVNKYLIVGENDHSLMQRLSNAGTDHRKFMRMLPVYVRIQRRYIGGKNSKHTKSVLLQTLVVQCIRSRLRSLRWMISVASISIFEQKHYWTKL